MVGEPAIQCGNYHNTIAAAKRKISPIIFLKFGIKSTSLSRYLRLYYKKSKKMLKHLLVTLVEKAVITVPAYFDDNQRQSTKDAGIIAGLDVVRIINEPTAASLAFGLDKTKQDLKILVFDFGGGTLDVTIMEMGGGVFEVMSTSGDTHLGGTDMDKTIVDYILDEFKKKEGIDLSSDTTAMTRIKGGSRKSK